MKNPLKIPTHTLPEGWRQKGADRFSISPSMVEKIVYGMKINDEVFDFMLELAETEKQRRDKEVADRKNRISALSK
jgi:hypothetical protein